MAAKKKTARQIAKRPRANAILKNLPEAVQEEMFFLRFPGEAGRAAEAMTADDVRAWLLATHKVRCSSGAFSEWQHWYGFRRDMMFAEARAEQARMREIAAGTVDIDALERQGQAAFMAAALADKNAKQFATIGFLLAEKRKASAREKLLDQKEKLIGQSERRVKLLEKKAERLAEIEAKAREIKAGGGLSAETLEMLEKQLKIL